MKWLDSITDSMDMNWVEFQEMVKDRVCCSPWGHRVGHDLSTELQQIHN